MGSEMCIRDRAGARASRAANATLEALAQAYTAAHTPRNVALTAWPSGGGPRYLVGELTRAEAGPAELRLRLRMLAAQARASAPESPPAPAAGFQAASCSLFLDFSGGHFLKNPYGFDGRRLRVRVRP